MDGTVRMWNWRAGECLRVMDGHTDGVISLNYNGYLLATGSADSTINVWNFRTGNRFTLRGHEEWVNNVVLWDGKTSPSDTDPAAIPSFTQAVSNRCQKSKSPAAASNEPTLPNIDPGAMLFSSSDDMTIKLWDLETAACIRTFEGHKAQVQSLRVLMVDMTEEEVAARDRRQRRQATPPTTGFTAASLVSPPGSQAAFGAGGASIHDASAGFDPLEHRGRSRSDTVQPRVYVHSPDGTHKKSEREQSRGHEKKAIVASGSLDGTVKIWDVETGREQSTLFGHIEGVWAVDIDALRLVSASHDRTIKVWEKESAQCVQTLVGHRGAVTSLQLSDDMIVSGSGKYFANIYIYILIGMLIGLSDDGDVMIWNFASSANNVSNTASVSGPCVDITPSPTPAIV